MTKSLKLIFLLIGFLMFGWAVSAVDMTVVFSLLMKLGAGFIIMLLIYSGVTWVDTIAWQKCFKSIDVMQLRLCDLWCIRIVGEAYNTITPLGTLGGEPVKAQLLKERYGLSLKQGIPSQVIARTTFLIALILFFVPGMFFLLQSSIISEKFKMACFVGMLSFSTLIFLFIIFQVTGALSIIAKWVANLQLGIKINVIMDKLKLVDQGISLYYKNHSSQIIISVLYAFAGWVIGLGELSVVLHFLGYQPNLIDLWIIESLAQLVRASSFFIPLSIGAQEAGLLLIFTALGMPESVGLTVSFARRIKELLWVGIGLIIGWRLAFHPSSQKQEN